MPGTCRVVSKQFHCYSCERRVWYILALCFIVSEAVELDIPLDGEALDLIGRPQPFVPGHHGLLLISYLRLSRVLSWRLAMQIAEYPTAGNKPAIDC